MTYRVLIVAKLQRIQVFFKVLSSRINTYKFTASQFQPKRPWNKMSESSLTGEVGSFQLFNK